MIYCHYHPQLIQLTDTSCSLFFLKICIFIVTETFMLAVKHPLGVFTLRMIALVHLHIYRVLYRRWRYACSWFVIRQYTLKRRRSSSSVMNLTLLLIGRALEMSVLGGFWAVVLRCKHTPTSSGSLQFFSLLGRQVDRQSVAGSWTLPEYGTLMFTVIEPTGLWGEWIWGRVSNVKAPLFVLGYFLSFSVAFLVHEEELSWTMYIQIFLAATKPSNILILAHQNIFICSFCLLKVKSWIKTV